MLHRLKRALVDSYVGAIALGFLLGEGMEQLAMVLTAPLAEWVGLREMHWISPRTYPEPGFRMQPSIGPLVHGVFFVLLGLALLRWLYYPAKANAVSEPVSGANADEQG
jgi:hypothetical protein